jgi:hypothetical protein
MGIKAARGSSLKSFMGAPPPARGPWHAIIRHTCSLLQSRKGRGTSKGSLLRTILISSAILGVARASLYGQAATASATLQGTVNGIDNKDKAVGGRRSLWPVPAAKQFALAFEKWYSLSRSSCRARR